MRGNKYTKASTNKIKINCHPLIPEAGKKFFVKPFTPSLKLLYILHEISLPESNRLILYLFILNNLANSISSTILFFTIS